MKTTREWLFILVALGACSVSCGSESASDPRPGGGGRSGSGGIAGSAGATSGGTSGSGASSSGGSSTGGGGAGGASGGPTGGSGGGAGTGPNIVWEAHYENPIYPYLDWHSKTETHPQFAQIPAYGRPVEPNPNNTSAQSSYFGDGSLSEIVTSPVRCGKHAHKLTVKNSANGSEPADCDNGLCTRRRTELQHHLVLFPNDGHMAYLQEYWMAVSVYVPADWDSGGTGWGPLLFQIKSPKTNAISPTFGIALTNGAWRVGHIWSHVDNPNSSGVIPWQYQMYYHGDDPGTGGGPYPNSSTWSDGLAHFPNVAASHAALANPNKGGWTDWVINVKWDGRGSDQGGTGFLKVWKRVGSGSWVHVLNILPGKTTRGGMTFDHGIGYKVPGSGFGPGAGMYMQKSQVWGLPKSRVVYNDCIRIGSAKATFAEMSPDGSTP